MRDASNAELTPRVVWESGSFHRCSRHAPCGAVNIHSRWLANKKASRVRSESETNGRRIGPILLCSAAKTQPRSVSPERGERGLQPHGDAALVQVPLHLFPVRGRCATRSPQKSATKTAGRSLHSRPELPALQLQPHGNAALVQVPLGLVNAELVEVEDRGREAGIGIRLGEHLVHVLGIATTG